MNKQVTVNNHFIDFIQDWNYKFYFLVGGYGSSKSYHVATKLLLKLASEKRLALVVREVYDTIRDSCFSLFEEVALRIGIYDHLKFKTSPMQVIFPNGSKIIFKGLDNPQKLKSINGVSIVWLEECSECKYEAYKELLGRLRHKELSNHIICSTNPVGTDNWTYSHFFKNDENNKIVLDDEILYLNRIVKTNNTYYHHSTCEDNAFLPQSYIDELNQMREYDFDLYRVARLGHYGANGEKVLPQFKVLEHDKVMDFANKCPSRYIKTGMDFGFVTSYNAVIQMAIDDKNKDLYIFNEYYSKGKTDDEIAKEIEEFKNFIIIADNAEPKSIAYFNRLGYKMKACKKFAGSRLANTKKIKRFKNIYCSDKCKHTIKELKNLTYKKDRRGNIVEDEFNIDPHTFSAIWYGLDDYEVADIKLFDRSKYNV
ncbi:PBSX family phage terminase large subunit [uncultured Megamonas sp.]|uniref:PBSX family phage terminase large subunit n=1 Tax=uncultured Megamonas sp. TaxID=286140 RepID=UPI00259B44A6|nr:PBSX family phage terminase large subunit [uncultured Megamonas sp.]